MDAANTKKDLQVYMGWIFDQIGALTHSRANSGHKGVRMRELMKRYEESYTTPEEWLFEAVNRAIREKRLVALHIETKPGYRPRASIVKVAYPFSEVSWGDDPMLYLPGMVPSRVVARVRGMQRAIERTLQIM